MPKVSSVCLVRPSKELKIHNEIPLALRNASFHNTSCLAGVRYQRRVLYMLLILSTRALSITFKPSDILLSDLQLLYVLRSRIMLFRGIKIQTSASSTRIPIWGLVSDMYLYVEAFALPRFTFGTVASVGFCAPAYLQSQLCKSLFVFLHGLGPAYNSHLEHLALFLFIYFLGPYPYPVTRLWHRYLLDTPTASVLFHSFAFA